MKPKSDWEIEIKNTASFSNRLKIIQNYLLPHWFNFWSELKRFSTAIQLPNSTLCQLSSRSDYKRMQFFSGRNAVDLSELNLRFCLLEVKRIDELRTKVLIESVCFFNLISFFVRWKRVKCNTKKRFHFYECSSL